eukprot:COSAG01_NODE_45_length_32100_cov_28.037218_20_plen_82_part_00
MLPKEEAEERLEVRMSGSFPGFVFLCRLAHNPSLRGGEPACSGSSSRRLQRACMMSCVVPLPPRRQGLKSSTSGNRLPRPR